MSTEVRSSHTQTISRISFPTTSEPGHEQFCKLGANCRGLKKVAEDEIEIGTDFEHNRVRTQETNIITGGGRMQPAGFGDFSLNFWGRDLPGDPH